MSASGTPKRVAAANATQEIKAGAKYQMEAPGIWLLSIQRGLFIRADGALLTCKAFVRNGQATLNFYELQVGTLRGRLVRWLLRL